MTSPLERMIKYCEEEQLVVDLILPAPYGVVVKPAHHGKHYGKGIIYQVLGDTLDGVVLNALEETAKRVGQG